MKSAKTTFLFSRLTVAATVLLVVAGIWLSLAEHSDLSSVHSIAADGHRHRVHLNRGNQEIYVDPGSLYGPVPSRVFAVTDEGRPIAVTDSYHGKTGGLAGSALSGMGVFVPNSQFHATRSGWYSVTIGDSYRSGDGTRTKIFVAPDGRALFARLLPGLIGLSVAVVLLGVAIARSRRRTLPTGEVGQAPSADPPWPALWPVPA